MTTLKNLFAKVYTIYACNPNEVYYLIKYKGRLVWRTLDEIDDCKDMFCFMKDHFTKHEMNDLATDLLNRVTPFVEAFDAFTGIPIKINKIPADITNIQISESVPTLEDGNMWVDSNIWWDVKNG